MSLVGPGGAGKTRLASHFAWRFLDQLAGGAWLIDLTQARSAMGLLHATATALEVPLMGGEDFDALSTRVGHALRARGPVLLVLDNFEQVVAHGAETVGRWLGQAPEALFLVTSREPLRVLHEEVLLLEPLPEADAVALFWQRVQDAGGRWPDTPETRATIARLVAALDGHRSVPRHPEEEM